MEQFLTFQLVNRRCATQNPKLFIPIPVLRDTVWEYLTYPHERQGKFVTIYNHCLLSLPKLMIFPGPRIIHDSRDAEKGFCLIKFIYTLHHAKDPASYITIHETTMLYEMPNNSCTCTPCEFGRYQRQKQMRTSYMARIAPHNAPVSLGWSIGGYSK